MKHFFASAFNDNPANLALLLLFCAVFVGILAWTLKPSRRGEMDRAARLPFND